MEPIGDLANATQQADAIFERLGEAITGAVTEKGASEINVLEVAQSAGLEIDAATLERLQTSASCSASVWCARAQAVCD